MIPTYFYLFLPCVMLLHLLPIAEERFYYYYSFWTRRKSSGTNFPSSPIWFTDFLLQRCQETRRHRSMRLPDVLSASERCTVALPKWSLLYILFVIWKWYRVASTTEPMPPSHQHQPVQIQLLVNFPPNPKITEIMTPIHLPSPQKFFSTNYQTLLNVTHT